MKKATCILALCCACVMPIFAKSGNEKLIKGTDSNIIYTGRTAQQADGSVSYDWVGTYVQTRFTGSSIAVDISETDTSYHNIFIDDQPVRKVKVYGRKPHKLVLADNLGKGTHTLRLQKCTEGEFGCTTIHGFYIDKNAQLSPVARKNRMIEFIGDSYTCGYGTEGKKATEHFKLSTENCNKAYGCIIARYFDADYALVAHSGRGMVRNYGDSVQISKANMSDRYGQLFDAHSTQAYDFKAYHPHLVIINLGTNDFSPTAIPSSAQYVGAYVKLIERVKANYGNVPVLCILPHSASVYLQANFGELKTAVAGMSKVYLATPMLNIVSDEFDTGSDWHPNYQGQQKIAMTLIPQISMIMGWQLNNNIQ
uniref:SGNH/GDSL hydrolase family protein n=1 Tax=Prevotella sp. GTC17254 TaxID=3236794 RepID=A0AB33J5V9_9BACT